MNNDKYNFDDITPLPVSDEAPETKDVVLCKIMYTVEFETVFSYLRALMAKDELSERAMYVACCAISIVPAHYTVWEYKYRIVEKLVYECKYDVDEELKWCADLALNNEKNYQIWNYRERVIELKIKHGLGGDKLQYDLDGEYEVVRQMLDSDEKNYHVWSHKRWIVSYFDLFRSDRELAYTQELIDRDVRNNSAWNFRHLVVFGDESPLENGRLTSEVEFAKQYIASSITNPSSWNYLKFLYSFCTKARALGEPEACACVALIRTLASEYSCNENLDDDFSKVLEEQRLSVPAFELLGDIYRDEGKMEQMRKVYRLLGEELDPVRRNYWAYRTSLCQTG